MCFQHTHTNATMWGDGCVNMIVVIMSQSIHTSSLYVVYFKYITFYWSIIPQSWKKKTTHKKPPVVGLLVFSLFIYVVSWYPSSSWYPTSGLRDEIQLKRNQGKLALKVSFSRTGQQFGSSGWECIEEYDIREPVSWDGFIFILSWSRSPKQSFSNFNCVIQQVWKLL